MNISIISKSTENLIAQALVLVAEDIYIAAVSLARI